MKRLLPLAFLAVAILFVLGLRRGWLHPGFSGAQLEELEGDWSAVVEWAHLPEPAPVAERNLTELASEWKAAELGREVAELRSSAGSKLPTFSRDRLSEGAAGFLDRFHLLLAEGKPEVPRSDYAISVLQLAQLSLQDESLDAEQLGRLLTLARDFQREGNLATFSIGVAIGKEALDRCRVEESLRPLRSDAPAPEVEEFFEALCRDYVLLHREQFIDPGNEGSEATEGFPDDGGFTESATRRAIANIVHRLHPLRSQPQRFDEVPQVEKPGAFTIWTATAFRRPEAMARVIESLIATSFQRRSDAWLEFITEWNAVL